MRTYEPRKRIALDVESIQDSEVKELINNLAALQKEVQGFNSGLDTQVNAGIQEAQAMIEKMTTVNQEFNKVLTSIKSQVQQLTNSAIQYVQANSSGLSEEQPKFRESFIYLTKNALTNIQKLVEGMKAQVGDVLQVTADNSPVNMELKSEDTPAVDMSPENLLTSSIIAAKENFKQRVAALLPAVMKTIEKIEPIVNQANSVNQNTEQLVKQLQDVIGTIPQTQAPVVENTEAFSPDISTEEVDAATGIEEGMNLEAPAEDMAAPGEVPTTEGPEAPETEEVAEDAPEVAEEGSTPAPGESTTEGEDAAAEEEPAVEEDAPETAEEEEEEEDVLEEDETEEAPAEPEKIEE